MSEQNQIYSRNINQLGTCSYSTPEPLSPPHVNTIKNFTIIAVIFFSVVDVVISHLGSCLESCCHLRLILQDPTLTPSLLYYARRWHVLGWGRGDGKVEGETRTRHLKKVIRLSIGVRERKIKGTYKFPSHLAVVGEGVVAWRR